MPQLSTEFWMQILVYVATIAIAWGQITTRIKNLEEKVTKHNNLVERMYVVEENVKITQQQITDIKEEINNELC